MRAAVRKAPNQRVDNPRLLAALDGRMVYFGTPDGRVNLAAMLHEFMLGRA